MRVGQIFDEGGAVPGVMERADQQFRASVDLRDIRPDALEQVGLARDDPPELSTERAGIGTAGKLDPEAARGGGWPEP